MKRRTWLLAPAVAAAIILAPFGTPAPSPAHAASLLENGFETPAAGAPYTLEHWAAEGFSSPREEGMDERSLLDGAVAHGGSQSLRVSYPAGKVGPEDSGLWASFELPSERTYWVSQWIRFDPDFSWGTTQFAGKVGIGLVGGAGCSGGQACDGTNGFSSRIIWRANGQAAVYYYSLNHEGQYGTHAILTDGGEDIHFPRGEWVNVIQRVTVNTVTNGVANPDGEIQVWYNGTSVAYLPGLQFVTNDDQIDRAALSTFAGGATSEFAPAHDSWIWYDDIKISTDSSDICELWGTC